MKIVLVGETGEPVGKQLQWLVDARLREFAVVWRQDFLAETSRFRVKLQGLDLYELSAPVMFTSRGLSSPGSRCLRAITEGLDGAFMAKFANEVSSILQEQAADYLQSKLESIIQAFLPGVVTAFNEEVISRVPMDFQALQALSNHVPTILRRGYPLYSEVHLASDIFGFDATNDVLKPLLITALSNLGAPASLTAAVSEAEPQPNQVDDLMIAANQMSSGTLSFSHLDLLAAAFGLDVLKLVELAIPILIVGLRSAGVPEPALEHIRQAGIEAEQDRKSVV